MKRLAKHLLIGFTVVSVLLFCIFRFVILPVKIVGNSLYPTLVDDQTGFSWMWFQQSSIKRFDIVIVKIPQTNDFMVKRIVGLPNETLEVKNDTLFINHQPVIEPFLEQEYVYHTKATTQEPFTFRINEVQLGPDQYYVLGDNRPVSQDSRFFGPVSARDIVSVGFFEIRH